MKLYSRAAVILCVFGFESAIGADDLPQSTQWKDMRALGSPAPPVSDVNAGAAAAGNQANCDFGDPTSFDLDARVAWSRSTSRCLKEVAEAEKVASQALAATDPAKSVSAAVIAAKRLTLAETIADGGENAAAQNQFLGLNWGVGIGASQLFDDAIEEASVVDGVVRVTKESRTEPRVLLEFHRFFFTREAGSKLPGTNGKAIKSGHGPFVAVAAKANDVLAGIAAGWMWGWKDSRLPASDDAFTVGLGLILDSEIKDLADGFEEGEPLPDGETSIRFEEKSRAGVVLLFTRSF